MSEQSPQQAGGNADHEFARRLRRHLDGVATPSELKRLGELMEANPSRIEEYLEQREVSELLEWQLGLEPIRPFLPGLRAREAEEVVGAKVNRAGRTKSPLVPLALAATVAFGLGWLVSRTLPGGHDTEAARSTAAVLLDSEDAEWAKREPMAFGEAFEPGENYFLQSGIARLAFASGAGLAVEGPADFRIESGDRVEVFEGAIAAYVPEEAIGFAVTAPGLDILDLGTRFGARIDPNGKSEVHVFEGQVEVEAHGARRLLEAGEAVRYAGEKTSPESIEVEEAAFVEPPSIEQLLAIGGTVRQEVDSSQEPLAPLGAEDRRRLEADAELLLFEDFRFPFGEIDGAQGQSLGFGQAPWRASVAHTQVVPRLSGEAAKDAKARARLLVRGRERSERSVVNRAARKLAEPLPSDLFFVSIAGRFEGLDEDDFFALWLDGNDRLDSSHSEAPNVGIRFGRFFARAGVDEAVYGAEAVAGEAFRIIARVERVPEAGAVTVSLLDSNGALVGEVDADVSWATSGLDHLGIRMGKDTELTDKLIIESIQVGRTHESVLRHEPR